VPGDERRDHECIKEGLRRCWEDLRKIEMAEGLEKIKLSESTALSWDWSAHVNMGSYKPTKGEM